MNLWQLFWSAYLVIAVFAISMTCREQRRLRQTTPLKALLGCVACTLWPLLVTAMLLLISADRKKS
ncbi:hypothetical protein KUV62_20155 [Salipiger bermudensis]|uniref:hypothetical protein n=1 Tax=Salipiger bermudensis TaxID=344736 RepID=UPI001C996D10|nr:hypothetical protein [Salipiger bermudensis]MBY6006248.1 hypothetical protein [Salipiger bermudensis]